VDQPEVSRTRHWSQKLESFATGPTAEGREFTSAWFSLNIGSCPKDPGGGIEGTGEEEVTRATSTFEALFKGTGKPPKTEAHYFHYRPEYLKNETGGFEGEMVRWPASDKNHRNHVFVFSTSGPFCPQIYSFGGYSAEFERWLTGSNGEDRDCREDRLFRE
jgi:hypothetical protein